MMVMVLLRVVISKVVNYPQVVGVGTFHVQIKKNIDDGEKLFSQRFHYIYIYIYFFLNLNHSSSTTSHTPWQYNASLKLLMGTLAI